MIVLQNKLIVALKALERLDGAKKANDPAKRAATSARGEAGKAAEMAYLMTKEELGRIKQRLVEI